MRIGFGYDSHKLVYERKLILGGVEVPYERGALAHSDGDVVIHALIDALFGAAGLGDIGKHFPDSDQKYKNISSIILLEQSFHLLEETKLKVNNIDATVVLEEPRLSPYIDEMEKKIADVLKIDKQMVNIKAKTAEGLGSLGAKEGIAAYAVCTLINST